MPWMIPSSPDEYLRLIEDVDRAEFGTHLDVVNMITSPRRYFYNDEFLEECFRKLHGTIISCHLKDIMLKQEYTKGEILDVILKEYGIKKTQGYSEIKAAQKLAKDLYTAD